MWAIDIALICFMAILIVWLLAYAYGSSHSKQPRKEIGNMIRRIIPEDHPDLVEGIEATYLGGRIDGIHIHKITIDEDDVNVEIDLDIDGAWGVHGTFQIELDDDNSLAEKLREIITLEEGND